MFPTDSDFLLLYFSYFGALLYFMLGFILTKKKSFKLNLIIFSIYTALMVYIFSDVENFRYGKSLEVLLLGGMFLFGHLIVCGIVTLIKNVKR